MCSTWSAAGRVLSSDRFIVSLLCSSSSGGITSRLPSSSGYSDWGGRLRRRRFGLPLLLLPDCFGRLFVELPKYPLTDCCPEIPLIETSTSHPVSARQPLRP